jgi:hypothetical protein
MDADGMIYMPSFMMIGTGIQTMLMLYLRNLRGFKFGINNIIL